MSKFSTERLCCGARIDFDNGEFSEGTSGVTAFHKDADRIINSSAFRRLQGKTQVYPFPLNDFVRNRLTHTNEVAHIGRTIMGYIAKESGEEPSSINDLCQIVSNACLLHDIGNPPFGHSGESSIREFFKGNEKQISLIEWAFEDGTYKNDLIFFDGNAQGFRVVTRLAGWKGEGGLRLSAATLTAMMKYAFGSESVDPDKGKFGFMSSEAKYATYIFERCGLTQGGILHRNPLSIIVEAADDIAYLTSDVQDSHRNGDIKFDRAKQVLSTLSSEKDRDIADNFNTKDRDYEDNVIGYLRSSAVSYMTKAAADILMSTVFDEKESISGLSKFDIWNHEKIPVEYKKISRGEEQIRSLCNKLVYRGKRKISLQVAGGRIIKFVLLTQLRALNEIYDKLYDIIDEYPKISSKIAKEPFISEGLDKYVHALVDNMDRFVSREAAQIFWGMPSDTHDIFESILIKAKSEKLKKSDPQTAYSLIQISLDFVSGTTDRYLSEYSRQWSGPSIA